MPLYEYRCEECATEFEFLHLKQDEQAECPKCRSQRLNRLLSVVNARMGKQPGPGCPPADAPPCHPRCCRLPQ